MIGGHSSKTATATTVAVTVVDIPSLVSSLGSGDLETARNAATGLRDLAEYKSHQGQIVAAGTIPALVDIINSSEDPEVQFKANHCLALLVVGNKDGRTLIVVEKAIPALVKFLGEPNVEKQAHAATCLASLAKRGQGAKIVAAGAIPVLVDLLKSTQLTQYRSALYCLMHLAAYKKHQVPIAEAGAIPILLHFLQSTHKKTQENAATCLVNLAWHHPGNLSAMMAEGAMPILLSLLQSSQQHERENGVYCLAYLGKYDSANKAMILEELSIIKPLLHLLISSQDKITQQSVLIILGWHLGLTNPVDERIKQKRAILAMMAERYPEHKPIILVGLEFLGVDNPDKFLACQAIISAQKPAANDFNSALTALLKDYSERSGFFSSITYPHQEEVKNFLSKSEWIMDVSPEAFVESLRIDLNLTTSPAKELFDRVRYAMLAFGVEDSDRILRNFMQPGFRQLGHLPSQSVFGPESSLVVTSNAQVDALDPHGLGL